MVDSDQIPRSRLANLNIASDSRMTPEEAVSSLGALQAQDYQASLWAIALRCKHGTTKREVENALGTRKVVRTWLLRGTLHCAASVDIKWITELIYPRLLRTAILRDQHLVLSNEIVERTKSVLFEALKGGNQLTRSEVYKLFENANVPTKNNLGYHMLYRAAWDGLICFGPHNGKEPSFVILNEWIPEHRKYTGNVALKELALRYFSSHGPATVSDYVWWSGIKTSDARTGIELASSTLSTEEIDGKIYYYVKQAKRFPSGENQTHLLPAFDEYLLGYKDRQAVLGDSQTKEALKNDISNIVHSNGVFLPTVVIDGQVSGVWKSKIGTKKVVVTVNLFRKLESAQQSSIREASDSYGAFLEQPVEVKIQA